MKSFLLSAFIHWALFFLLVGLVAGLSVGPTDASIFILAIVILINFCRFFLWEMTGGGAFLAGGLSSTLSFPISVAFFDWAIGNGPGPSDYRFYLSAARSLCSRDAMLFSLMPLLVVAGTCLISSLLGICMRYALRRNHRSGSRD